MMDGKRDTGWFDITQKPLRLLRSCKKREKKRPTLNTVIKCHIVRVLFAIQGDHAISTVTLPCVLMSALCQRVL